MPDLDSHTWKFTADEFVHVWARELDRDRYPYPIVPQQTARTEEQADRVRQEATARYPLRKDADLSAVLRTCVHPQVATVVIIGTYKGEPIRFYAATFRDRATSIFQHADGRVMVDNRLIAGFSNILLEVIERGRAGRQPELVEQTDALGAGRTVAARSIQALLATPTVSAGTIAITPPPDDYGDAQPTRYRSWALVEGDGRYLCASGTKFRVWPCDDMALGREIQRLLVAG